MSDPLRKSTFACVIQRMMVLGLCTGLLAGCSDPTPPPVVEPGNQRRLTIGLMPEQNIFRQLERYEPLVDYISGHTRVQVELKLFDGYGSGSAEFEQNGMDGAFFGSFAYVLAHERAKVIPLVRPLTADHSSTYFGMVLVRQDSGIRSVAGMRGKRFAFVDRATTAGYLLPLGIIADHGIENYRRYFAETYFAGTHEDALYDVLMGQADICAIKNTVFERLARQDPRLRDELTMLFRSPDVPENGLALRATIEPAVLEEIKSTLLAMHGNPEGQAVLRQFGAQKFIETTHEDYQPVYDYLEHIGIDPATYDLEDE